MSVKARAVAALRQFDVGDKFAHLAVPKAAVLVPLFVRGQEVHVVLTLRSRELRSHGGEVCFPGGKRDPSDRDDVDTALREAQEEIGLPPGQVDVVCRLVPVINKGGLMVTPVVGFIDESFRPTPNPAEVSAVFAVPLDAFTREQNHRRLGPLHCFTHTDHTDHTDHTSRGQFRVWGLTAALAVLVAVCALRKNTEFHVGFEMENPLQFYEQNLLQRLSKL